MRSRDSSRSAASGWIGVLDIGSSKVCCIIAEPDLGAAGTLRAIGFGLTRSRGIKSGIVTDLDEAEGAVRSAVGQAERAAGGRLDAVHVGVACGRLKSLIFKGRVATANGVVGDGDIDALYRGARSYAERDGRSLVLLNRLDVMLDGAKGIRDPRGMAARELAAELHAVTADEAPLRNLLLLLDRCHLRADSLVPAALASALAVTSADERRIGVTCLDIGGGTTTIATFSGGHFIHTDVVPIGGKHVTFDIARDLNTPLAEAERIKTLYGTLAVAASDEHERIAYPGADETEQHRHETTKALLAGLVRQRLVSLFELARERIDSCPAAARCSQRIVITGGASQTMGIAELAANVLGRPVRLARPVGLAGLPGSVASPSLAVANGLAVGALASEARIDTEGPASMFGHGYLGRVERWLRESF